MKNTAALVLTAFAAAVLAGCGEQELDCTQPRNQQEQELCTHKESTEPRIPATPPANPMQWGLDGVKEGPKK